VNIGEVLFTIDGPNLVEFRARDLNVMLLLILEFLQNRHRQGTGFRVGIDKNTVTRFTVKSYCIMTVTNALLKNVNYVTILFYSWSNCMLMPTVQRETVLTHIVHFVCNSWYHASLTELQNERSVEL
jgi:hypothetical protein